MTHRRGKASLQMTSSKPTQTRHLSVITTHANADFDALASMLAAQKLFPEAQIVFPGTQEQSLRNFFISSMAYLFNMVEIKDLDLAQIGRLIIVDTRQPDRIGPLAGLLEEAAVEVHVYDHHPRLTGDVRANFDTYQPVGATVTILAEILESRSIPITADEATVMCLGIYEDTGAFSFPSTTEADFRAAAFLMSKGADINTIAGLISRDISPKQIAVLNDLLQALTPIVVNGIEIVLVRVTYDQYLTDLAFLIHKVMKMENLQVLFVIARMENKIHLIARSRLPEVDVAEILKPMGGGGHPYAAAVTLKGLTFVQAEHRLMESLNQHVESQSCARQIMSAPPISVTSNVTCRQAAETLNRYNINALLVTRSGSRPPEIKGVISRQVIEKALYHQLEHVLVEEYMTTEISVVGPQADLNEIQDKIFEHNQRVLPVVDAGRILGVITRTDLLKLLVHQSKHASNRLPDHPNEPSRYARRRNINRFLKERTSQGLLEILRKIGQTAAQIGVQAYVVGGFVRDLFLYKRNEDIDIVVEGDGIRFAKHFAETAAARVHTHKKFGTAVIIFDNGFKIDVATARTEYYASPAALPEVEMSSIKLDLYRRDFTINTLAVALNPEHFGILVDFFLAQADIKDRVIRILHNLSFVEDPTRVFRAIRFEQRFGFTIGKLTRGLIENAVKMAFFDRLSGRRVFTELRLILSEENPIPAIIRLNDFDLLKVIHPTLTLGSDLVALLDAVKKVLAWYELLFIKTPYDKWSVYFMALFSRFDETVTRQVCHHFELPPRFEQRFVYQRLEAQKRAASLERRRTLKNSVLYQALQGLRTELILYIMAMARQESLKKAISLYMTDLRQVQLEISGKDLKQMGFQPGPLYRDVLDAVLARKLDGHLNGREEELAAARAMGQTHTKAPPA